MNQCKPQNERQLSRSLALMAAVVMLVGVNISAQTSLLAVEGSAAFDQFGRVLAVLPDVNGDGIPDIASGSPLRAATAGILTGVVEIVSGSDGTILLVLEGSAPFEEFGSALLAVDVTGDGNKELLVGSPGASVSRGSVSAYAIPSGSLLFTLNGTQPSSRFGSAVCLLGDLNADSTDEFVVAAPRFNGVAGVNSGLVTIHGGSLGASTFGSFEGAAAFDQLGQSLAPLGDIDGDFLPDFAAGAPLHDGPGGTDAGRVYLLSSFAALVSQLDGQASLERFGTCLAGPGDLDADSQPEVLVGAPFATTAAGAFSGRLDAWPTSGGPVLWSRDGQQSGEHFGAAIAVAGDQDGDALAEILVGAPLFDALGVLDAGRVEGLSGASGAFIFESQGTSSSEQRGFAMAGGADYNLDGAPDVLLSEPFHTGNAGTQSGRFLTFIFDPNEGREIRGYRVGVTPEKARAVDADGDGDLDIAVVCSGDNTLHILWNGDHTTAGSLSFGTGRFDTLPPSIIALESTAQSLSLSGGQLDTDDNAELVVGRSDGTIEVIDGIGTVAAPGFSAVPQLLIADSRSTPLQVADVAVVGSGINAEVAFALQGTIVTAGAVAVFTDVLTLPTRNPDLLAGGAFVGLQVADINNSGDPDIVATNSSMGASGGVHILLGPTYSVATGSPFGLSGVPINSAVAALDFDGLQDDVLVAEIGFGTGGAGVLSDFNTGGGFGTTVAPTGPSVARAIAPWRPSQFTSGAAIVDGLGTLSLFEGWTGSGFTTQTPFPAGSDLVAVSAAQLTAYDGASDCNGEELIAVARSSNTIRIVRQRIQSLSFPMPGTLCVGTPTSPTLVVNGDPVVGNAAFSVGLTGGTPLAPAIFVVQIPPAPGILPTVLPLGPCGVLNYSFNWITINFALDGAGDVLFPLPLPQDPSLLCQEFAIQWAVADGGPVGGFTVSDGYVVRFGEY